MQLRNNIHVFTTSSWSNLEWNFDQILFYLGHLYYVTVKSFKLFSVYHCGLGSHECELHIFFLLSCRCARGCCCNVCYLVCERVAEWYWVEDVQMMRCALECVCFHVFTVTWCVLHYVCYRWVLIQYIIGQ